VLKLGVDLNWMKKIAAFCQRVWTGGVVIEEGDPYLVEGHPGGWIAVEGKAEMYRFGEWMCPRAAHP